MKRSIVVTSGTYFSKCATEIYTYLNKPVFYSTIRFPCVVVILPLPFGLEGGDSSFCGYRHPDHHQVYTLTIDGPLGRVLVRRWFTSKIPGTGDENGAGTLDP